MDYRDILRRLAIGDTSFLEESLSEEGSGAGALGLDQKVVAFARLAASVAIATSPSGYQGHVDAALAAGASMDEIVGVLIAVAPTVGWARSVLAAPPLGLALGYDTDAALERLDSD
jgi:alkylhydroperoxidase/carboxymuconolactone decarboxylase family protein YurZ